ncbi:unnamed protein product [Diatraea saccharalis]|uniref:Uncharacterized protein n=1 Tax=Diatraea saccharalis TaxID=40085 RepID=A0A9N9R265_9NEOP|nr:unnamed protein product [Diatraea saccharalis]
MLACVCQPTETALLFKGGPPVAMGPLGTGKIRHNPADAMKTLKLLPKQMRRLSEDNSSYTSSPSLVQSSGSLLNLRKIEKKAKSTKILVNPVCSDSVGTTSDESNPPKTKKWNVKKKRLKSDTRNRDSNREDSISRDTAKEDKKSISCFKMKHNDDKSRSEDDKKSGRENCTNENASNLMNAEKPDLINYSRNSSKEILVDESTMTDESMLVAEPGEKTDSAIAVKSNEVSCSFCF